MSVIFELGRLGIGPRFRYNPSMKCATPDARDRLERHGLRVTRPRLALLDCLARARRPLTIEEIHAELASICDWATVFRCLKRFEELDIVRRCEFGDRHSRYELAAGRCGHGHHHHHLVCRACGSVKEVGDCGLAALESSLASRSGFRDISHSLEFFGLCPACRKAAAPRRAPARPKARPR